MASLGENQWGKSEVRVSKIIKGDGEDAFLDLRVQILLTGDVEGAYVAGDNSAVLPTDTSKNTVYGLAQDHLTEDIESFAKLLGGHMVGKEGIDTASVSIKQARWQRAGGKAFLGGSSESRTATVKVGNSGSAEARSGIEGLVVLKTSGSAFSGFPRDEFTTLPEAEDRLLATSITAAWTYRRSPGDTSAAWEQVRSILLEHFFGDWSVSVQHQGWLMAEAVFDEVDEVDEISFELPNQHHLGVDLSRFNLPNTNTVFHPVSEPYGDIRFTAHR